MTFSVTPKEPVPGKNPCDSWNNKYFHYRLRMDFHISFPAMVFMSKLYPICVSQPTKFCWVQLGHIPSTLIEN